MNDSIESHLELIFEVGGLDALSEIKDKAGSDNDPAFVHAQFLIICCDDPDFGIEEVLLNSAYRRGYLAFVPAVLQAMMQLANGPSYLNRAVDSLRSYGVSYLEQETIEAWYAQTGCTATTSAELSAASVSPSKLLAATLERVAEHCQHISTLSAAA